MEVEFGMEMMVRPTMVSGFMVSRMAMVAANGLTEIDTKVFGVRRLSTVMVLICLVAVINTRAGTKMVNLTVKANTNGLMALSILASSCRE